MTTEVTCLNISGICIHGFAIKIYDNVHTEPRTTLHGLNEVRGYHFLRNGGPKFTIKIANEIATPFFGDKYSTTPTTDIPVLTP